MGGSPDEAWTLVADGDLVAVAALMQRCAWSGAPVAVLLGDLARDMREQVRAEALAEASALGVRSAGPLGVCFLPAFVSDWRGPARDRPVRGLALVSQVAGIQIPETALRHRSIPLRTRPSKELL